MLTSIEHSLSANFCLKACVLRLTATLAKRGHRGAERFSGLWK